MFPQAGIELVVVRAAASISQMFRFGRALDVIRGKSEAAALASLEHSRAYTQQQSQAQVEVLAWADAVNQANLEALRQSDTFKNLSREQQLYTVAMEKHRSAVARAAFMQTEYFKSLESGAQKAARAQLLQEEATRRQTVAFTLLGSVLLTVSAKLARFLGGMVKMAADQQRVSRGTETLAKNLGLAEEAVKKTQAAITAQGYTIEQAYKAVGKLAAANVDYEKAVTLATIANDIATQQNRDATEVFEALTDAMANASVTTLRGLDIGESAEKIFAQYASSVDKVAENLSTAERRLAIWNYIVQRGAQFAGAYANSLDTVTTQSNLLKANIHNLGVELGEYLLPAITKGISLLNDLVTNIRELPPEIKKGIAQILGLATAFAGVLGSAVLLKQLLPLLGGALKLAFAHPVAAAIALIVGGLSLVVMNAKKAKEELTEEPADVAGILRLMKKTYEELKQRSLASIDAVIFAKEKIIESMEKMAKGIERARYDIQKELDRISDGFFALQVMTLELDKPLYPLMDALTRVEAATTLTLIPLRRRQRLLQREIEDLREISDEEEKRLQKQLDALKERLALAKELLAQERDVQQAIQHDIFMEELRNKILKRGTSGHLLELKSSLAVQQDIVARRQEEINELQEQIDNERERIKLLKEAAQTQLEAAEKNLKAVERQIALYEEQVQFQQEELELARARQVEERLLITQRRRMLEEEQLFAQHRAELLDRQANIIQHQTELIKEQLEELKKKREKIESMEIDIRLPGLTEANSAIAGLGEKATDLGTKFEQTINSLNAKIDEIFGMGGTISNAIKDSLGRNGSVSKQINDFVDRWFSRKGELGTKINGFISRTGDSINEFIEKKVPEFFKGLWRTVTQTVPSEATKIVDSFIDGLIEGLNRRWKDFRDNLLGKLGLLPKQAAKEISAFSPSKKMVPIGEAIVSGISLGMARGFSNLYQEIPRHLAQIEKQLSSQLANIDTDQIYESRLQMANSMLVGPAVRKTQPYLWGANNYTTIHYHFERQPTFQLTAQYGQARSEAGILEDFGMLNAMV